MLRVDIRDLQRGPVKTVGTLGPEDPVFEGLGLELDGPVEVNGQLQATGAGEYLWRGHIHGMLRGECRRCLIDVRHPLDREHYVAKQVKPVAEPVLETLGLDFDRVIGDERQLDLLGGL